MTGDLDIETLANLEPFSSFSAERLLELLDFCHVETVPQGGNPVKLFGLDGKSVYLIGGRIELFFRDGHSMAVSVQTEIAKHPLGKRLPGIVSASALCESRLLHVDDGLLDRIMVLDHVCQQDLAGNAPPLSSQDSPIGIPVNAKRLFNAGMFSADSLKNGPLVHVPTANIGLLLQRIEAIAVRAGDIIIREGDDGDYYYLMDSGRARVTRCVGGVDLPLAELKEGDVFGEEALISDAKRNATVVMESVGTLLRLGRQDFLALLKEPLLHKINYHQAMEAAEQGAVWLDVGSPPEHRYDRLDGAMNIPLNDIRNAIGILDRGRKYIAYCQSGRRSAAAAFILTQAGYNVQVLDGGLWSVPRPTHQ
jgi:rhodanese-related sulfurtransferase